MADALRPFDRVSVGFPGVVEDHVVKTAPNLHRAWKDFPLGRMIHKATAKPVHVLNDAGIQGYAVIEGRGVELVLTLGTGFGFALYLDGQYVPNLEVGEHPFRGRKTYEDLVGGKALDDVGKAKWNRRVEKVLTQIQPIWNPRKIYIGGGNAKHLKIRLPRNVTCVPNLAGLLGGIVLWGGPRPRVRRTSGHRVPRPAT